MSAQLRILSWKATGFRCPDHRIDLVRDDGTPAPVCLVQMPNGTGKTTTLQLLRAALSGEADKWTHTELRELRKQAVSGPSQPPGLFELRAMVDETLLTVELNADFEEGQAYYTTTIGEGKKPGFKPPKCLRDILRPDFVKFFVFDGELAGDLLDRKQTKAEGVIDSLFRLGLFEDLRILVAEWYEEELKKLGGGADRGLARASNLLQKLQGRLDHLKVQEAKEREAIKNLKERILVLDNKHKAAINDRAEHRDRLNRTTKERERARNIVEKKVDGLLGDMRSPHRLASSLAAEMLLLMQSLDRVKLPESTAREFFEELAEEAECVCGRPLDAERQMIVRTRAKQYLGSEEMNLLNNLKASVKEAVGSDPASGRESLDAQVDKLRQAMKDRKQAETECREVQQDAADSDPEIAAAQAELMKLRAEMEQKELAVGKYEESNMTRVDENSNCISDLAKECKRLETRITELTHTQRLKDQHDILKNILQRSKTHASQLLKADVCERTNIQIAKLMPLNRLRVRGIDGCLQLHNPDSGRSQAGGSVGENLAVAYAFLSTLFSRSRQHNLPFVVDSPAGPLDGAKRRQVAELVPKLSDQFVAFTINTEQEAFVEPLEAALRAAGKGDPLFRTLFRRGSHPVGEDQGVLTADGHLVNGREFFTSFRNQPDFELDS